MQFRGGGDYVDSKSMNKMNIKMNERYRPADVSALNRDVELKAWFHRQGLV